MIKERFIDMTRSYVAMKCINCGEVVDPGAPRKIPQEGTEKSGVTKIKTAKKGYFRYASVADGASANEAVAIAKTLVDEILSAKVPAGVKTYTVFSQRLNEIGLIVADDEGALDLSLIHISEPTRPY